MMNTITLGSKVKLQKDNGWGSPGCVMSYTGDDKLRIYWPDENVFTCERLEELIPYAMDIATHPQEVAA